MFKHTVADWMEDEGIPHAKEANKYLIGQNLTDKQAKEIILMIAKSVGIKYYSPKKCEFLKKSGSSYQYAVYKYTALIVDGMNDETNWADALWGVLDREDKIACNDIGLDYLAYRVNMASYLRYLADNGD